MNASRPLDFVAGIDEHALPRARAGDDEAVLEERADGLRLDYHHAVILAILDDLMFTSKIKTRPTSWASRSPSRDRPQGALRADARANAPSLVILDLNNPRTDPLGTVAAMRADPALAADSDGRLRVARATRRSSRRRAQAGVGEVMARSAFTEGCRRSWRAARTPDRVLVSAQTAILRTNRNFRLLFFGQTISQLGDWFNSVAVFALLLDLTGSATAVAWMMIVQFLPMAIIGPIAGVVVDRVDRRRLMIATDLMRGVLVLGLLLVRTRGAGLDGLRR